MLKNIFKLILSYINKTVLYIQKKVRSINSDLLLVNIFSPNQSNKVEFINASVKKTSINILGNNNIIIIKGNHSNLKINVIGNDNKLEIGFGTKSIEGEIVIRGHNCLLSVGDGTTFGKKAYIVCMGVYNKVLIGKENMFADNIEIWNTDSHPIYDASGTLLNPSKPVEIGNHIWVGKKVCILKGSIISDNAVIGMASIVSGQHINSNTLNVGSPIRCIKDNINWNRNFIQK